MTTTSVDPVDGLYRAAAAEVHPHWCEADPLGCAGVHVSTSVEIAGTPVSVAGTLADPGRFAVVVQVDAAGRELALTAEQARELAAVLARTADLPGTPGRSWSRPYGQIRAYGEALARSLHP